MMLSRKLVAFLYIAIALNLYIPSLQGPYQYDSTAAVRDNVWVQGNHDILPWFERRQTDPDGYFTGPYRPLTMISYSLNAMVFGNSAFWNRWIQVLLHALVAMMLFIVVRQYFAESPQLPLQEKAKVLAFVVGLVFLLHPAATQAVNFIWKRSTILTAFFSLVAVLTFSRYLVLKRWRYYAWTCAAFVAAILSKEAAICVPIVLAIVTFIWPLPQNPNHQQRFQKMLVLVPLFVATAIYGWFYLKTAPHYQPLFDKSAYRPDKGVYLFTQAKVIWQYIWTLFYPLQLNIDQHIGWFTPSGQKFVWAFVVGHITVLLLSFSLIRSKPAISGLIWLFYAVLMPTTLWVMPRPIDEDRLYMPLMLFAIAVTYVLFKAFHYAQEKQWLPTGNRIGRFVTMVGCLLLAGLTFMRNTDWSSSVRLWQASVEENPENPVAYYYLARAYEHEKKDYEKALIAYQEILKHDYAASIKEQVQIRTGILVGRLGQLDESKKIFESIARHGQYESAQAYYLLGLGYYYTDDFAEAMHAFDKALEKKPTLQKVHMGRAMVYEKQANYERAIESWQTFANQPDAPRQHKRMANKAIARIKLQQPQNK